MDMEMLMEEDEYSFDSNTDAIIYGVSDPSGSDQSLISDPNISSSSSSDDDISHHEQKQIQISTAAAPVIGISDDLSVSSSGWITNNNNKQIEEKEAAIMIFNVDFGALSRVAVHNEERKKLNSCEQIVKDPFSEPTQDDEPINWGKLKSPWLEDMNLAELKLPELDINWEPTQDDEPINWEQLESPWLEDINWEKLQSLEDIYLEQLKPPGLEDINWEKLQSLEDIYLEQLKPPGPEDVINWVLLKFPLLEEYFFASSTFTHPEDSSDRDENVEVDLWAFSI